MVLETRGGFAGIARLCARSLPTFHFLLRAPVELFRQLRYEDACMLRRCSLRKCNVRKNRSNARKSTWCDCSFHMCNLRRCMLHRNPCNARMSSGNTHRNDHHARDEHARYADNLHDLSG